MFNMDALGSLDMFQNLSNEDLGKIYSRAKEETYPSGALILREGASGGMLHVIMEGRVEVRKKTPGGEEKPLATLGPGTVFGEMSLFDGFPYSANVVATEETRTLSMFRNDFMALAESEPAVAFRVTVNLLNILSLKLRKTNENLMTLALLRDNRG
jgi:CRP/FNR family transcriptional regulator, cyclic AMP receptor protein